jgi:C2H2-type zinc finger
MPRARRSQIKPAPARPTQPKPKPRAKRAASAQFKCPECGKTFSRAAALGAHRSRIHGVAGKSRSARTSRAAAATGRRSRPATQTARTARARAAAPPSLSSDGSTVQLNRDTLLQALFPNGVPAREAVIREANDWLDQAERLARMK